MSWYVILIMFSHRSCHTCVQCSRSLELGQACDGPDREVYCTPCHARCFTSSLSSSWQRNLLHKDVTITAYISLWRRFGLHGYGFGGVGSLPALTAGGREERMEYHYTRFFWSYKKKSNNNNINNSKSVCRGKEEWLEYHNTRFFWPYI